MRTVALILEYEEPGWTEATIECAKAAGLEHLTVARGGRGTGPITSFNKGMKVMPTGVDWVWFLTNVTFEPEMLETMVRIAGRDPDCAVVHPAHYSDHPHLRPDGRPYEEVPFIEWTAPLVSTYAWRDVGELDEGMKYWGMDLDWSFRARLRGWKLYVSRLYRLEHVHLKDAQEGELPVTTRRRQVRAAQNRATEQRLRQKWGDEWMKLLWPTHPWIKRKGIYL